MGRRPFVASAIVLVVLSLQVDVPALESSSVQGPRLEGDQSIPSGAEFPPQDEQVLSLLRKGSAAKNVRRRLTDSPDTPETIRLLAVQERPDEMLRALELLVRRHPERISESFELLLPNMHRLQKDDGREYKPRLAQIVAEARKQLLQLPREASARGERVLLEFDGYISSPGGNRDDRTRKLTNFIQTHSGTEAALVTEVDVLTAGPVSLAQLDSLEAFAREHPHTVAAAKATYLRGFNLAINVPITGIEKRGSDPTERFLRLVAIARELESGAFPAGEWVDQAPSIVWSFFASNPTYIPGNLQRVIDASYEFVKTHFTLAENPGHHAIGYFVTDRIPVLMKAQGDEAGGMERLFLRLEQDVPDRSAVRYLRAVYYLRNVRESPSERAPMMRKAIDALADLQAQGPGLYHRKALATLGALRFAERDFVNARADLTKYAQLYPDSDWAWIAALRAGLCDQEIANAKEAAETHLAVSAKYGSNPVARVLAHAYAAWAYEGQQRFDRALREYRDVLDGWDNDYGPAYSLYLMRPPRAADEFGGGDASLVSKQTIARRVTQLEHSLADRGGEQLERGRWLLERQHRQDAIAALQALLADRRTSVVAPEARYLMHRAQFEVALDLADADRAPDDAAAGAALDRLASEPLDFAVTAARIAKASILWKSRAPEAESSMLRALDEWFLQQSVAIPADPLERDVADIRRVVFLQKGGGVYGNSRWNAFEWPGLAPPFAIVNPRVPVKLANDEVLQVSVKQKLMADTKVLFLDDEQLGLLRATIVRLGGNHRRVPTGVMETPNQPVGTSMDILELWRRFFPARPGHWGGWVLETYPIVTEITFVDAARTRAEVAVTIGYSGGTVIVEKERGVWTAKRFTNQWIT